MKRHFLCCFAVLAMSILAVSAQERNNHSIKQGWYAGIRGEVPTGVCTFSSFGSGGNGIGWGGGVYVGRALGGMLSAEVSAGIGHVGLSARGCCVERGYWLGSDRVRYNAQVVDLEGWSYDDLESSVSVMKFDARLNVNVLGLLAGPAGRASSLNRWAVEISPVLAATCSKADIKAWVDGENSARSRGNVIKADSKWNFGAGGCLQLCFSVTERVDVALYSELLTLVGRRFDGLPKHQHGANMLWNNGFKAAWTFGKESSVRK